MSSYSKLHDAYTSAINFSIFKLHIKMYLYQNRVYLMVGFVSLILFVIDFRIYFQYAR